MRSTAHTPTSAIAATQFVCETIPSPRRRIAKRKAAPNTSIGFVTGNFPITISKRRNGRIAASAGMLRFELSGEVANLRARNVAAEKKKIPKPVVTPRKPLRSPISDGAVSIQSAAATTVQNNAIARERIDDVTRARPTATRSISKTHNQTAGEVSFREMHNQIRTSENNGTKLSQRIAVAGSGNADFGQTVKPV